MGRWKTFNRQRVRVPADQGKFTLAAVAIDASAEEQAANFDRAPTNSRCNARITYGERLLDTRTADGCPATGSERRSLLVFMRLRLPALAGSYRAIRYASIARLWEVGHFGTFLPAKLLRIVSTEGRLWGYPAVGAA
jgi:hypothetical protein